MNTNICGGSFYGGEIEPGTFHVMVDPRDGERDPATDGGGVSPAESDR